MKFSNGGFEISEQNFWNKIRALSFDFDNNSIYDYWILFVCFNLGIIKKDKTIILQIQYIIKSKINLDNISSIVVPVEELKLTNLNHCKIICEYILQYNYNNSNEEKDIYFQRISNNLLNLFEPDIEIFIPKIYKNKRCSKCNLQINNIPLFKINDNQYLCPNCFYSI